MIKTVLMSSGHWKALVPFSCKRTFNITGEVSQNRTEKQIMSLKRTVNWLLNDM